MALVVLIIILGLLCLLLCWLLMAPVELELNTEVPEAKVRWVSIGSFRIWYEDEWWFSVRTFFFQKTFLLAKIKKKPKVATGTPAKAKQKRNLKYGSTLGKIKQVVQTLQVIEWQLAIDTGRFDENARLYPLNFLSLTSDHLLINFQGNNFFKAKLRGQPWKIVYAFLQ